MKKLLMLSLLTLAVVSSLTAGTLANYTITIDALAYGSAVGKEFIFAEEGTDTFDQGAKIAPGETVQWQFAVKNFSDSVITETNLYYRLTFGVSASADKQAIDPLIVTVKDENGRTVGQLQGTGSILSNGTFLLSDAGQADSYTLTIYWPKNDAIDAKYAGAGFGTSIHVSALASQLPIQ